MLRITSAQINPTVGDITGNIALMLKAARQARDEYAQIVVFPELSLTAYYPGDLLDDANFQARIEAGRVALAQATRETPNLLWVVGAPTRREGVGKPYHNSLLVFQNGETVLQYAKQLLPTYNIFDERRHFEPGPDVARVLRVGNIQVGLMVCEDGWNDEGKDYAVNPFQRLADAAPDLIVSINASPSNVGKREERHAVFSKACARHKLPLLYVSQVGGHDQLVYDGGSFAVDAKGAVVYEAKRFESDVATLDFDTKSGEFSQDGKLLTQVPQEGLSTVDFYHHQLVLGLKDYARRCGFKQAVVGCSGGIDSALTLALAVEALGAKNVVGITMPSEYSSEGSVSDSVTLCNNLGIELLTHPIKDLVEGYKAGFNSSTGSPLRGLPLENVQARIRGTILMEYSNAFGHLLLTTGNKSEVSVGYCTLYGDTNGGLSLIGDLYKTEVFELSRHVNTVAKREVIPVAIIDKAPSAELAPDQRDTDSLPPYSMLDEVLKHMIEGSRLPQWEKERSDAEMAALQSTSSGRSLISRVQSMIARNEYKRRQAPPVLRVRGRAFGSGRQMPIAAVHYD
jgi:NAD+ synthetase